MVNNLNFFVSYDLTHVREQVTTALDEQSGENVYNLSPDFEYQINIDSSDTTTGFRDYVQFYLDVDDNMDSITADDTTNVSIKSVSIKFHKLLFTHPRGYLRYFDTNNRIGPDNEFIATTSQKDKTDDSSITWSLVETGFEHVGRQIIGALEMTNNESDVFIQKGVNETIFVKFGEDNTLNNSILKYSETENPTKYNAAKNFIIQLQNHLLNMNLEDTNEPHDLTPDEVSGDPNEDSTAVPIDLDMTQRDIKSISLYIKITTSLKVGGEQQADDDKKESLIRIVLNKDDINYKSTLDTTVDTF